MPRDAVTFDQVLAAAVDDLIEHGYDDDARVQFWLVKLEEAARADFIRPKKPMEQLLRDHLSAEYDRLVERGGLLRRHPGIRRVGIEKVRTELRQTLWDRIKAAANLIVLNREEEIATTMRRFEGWATSIPAGGSEVTKRKKVKQELRKGIAGLSFRERRVLIDQGHKMNSEINRIVAESGEAIAALWVSHYKQVNYDYRPEHKQFAIKSAKKPFLIRGSWAIRNGLIVTSGATYTDEVEQPGFAVYCRCYYEYVYDLASLPDAMLTAKGRAVKRQMAA